MLEQLYEAYLEIIKYYPSDELIVKNIGNVIFELHPLNDLQMYPSLYSFEYIDVTQWARNRGLDWKDLTLEDFSVMMFETSYSTWR